MAHQANNRPLQLPQQLTSSPGTAPAPAGTPGPQRWRPPAAPPAPGDRHGMRVDLQQRAPLPRQDQSISQRRPGRPPDCITPDWLAPHPTRLSTNNRNTSGGTAAAGPTIHRFPPPWAQRDTRGTHPHCEVIHDKVPHRGAQQAREGVDVAPLGPGHRSRHGQAAAGRRSTAQRAAHLAGSSQVRRHLLHPADQDRLNEHLGTQHILTACTGNPGICHRSPAILASECWT